MACGVSSCPAVLVAGSMPGGSLCLPATADHPPLTGCPLVRANPVGPPLKGPRGACRRCSAASGVEGCMWAAGWRSSCEAGTCPDGTLLQRTRISLPPGVQQTLLQIKPSLQLCCLALAARSTVKSGTPPCLHPQSARWCPGPPTDRCRPPRPGCAALLSRAAHE